MSFTNPLPIVSVVIPVYNRKEKTIRCLSSLYNSTQVLHKLHVVVVDDGSIDGTSESIMQLFPQTSIVSGTGSLFWTGAVNLGIQESLTHGSQYVLILNDDTLHAPDFIDKMVTCSQHHDNAIVGAKILYLSKNNSVRFAGADWDLFKWGWYYPHDKCDSDSLGMEAFPVKSINGNCCLLPVDVINRIGLYDADNYPHLYADSAFTITARRHGVPLYIEPKACVWDDDSDIMEKLCGPDLKGFNLISHVFLRKTSPYNLKAFSRFTITTSPNVLLGLILYLTRILRLFLKVLFAILSIRPFYRCVHTNSPASERRSCN